MSIKLLGRSKGIADQIRCAEHDRNPNHRMPASEIPFQKESTEYGVTRGAQQHEFARDFSGDDQSRACSSSVILTSLPRVLKR